MIILGIDPALTISGYGAIQTKGGRHLLIEAGVIKTSPKEKIEIRLKRIYSGIFKLIADIKPEVLVLEKLYAHYRHPTTAYILGQARGVICLAAAMQNIALTEYAATRVKKAVVGQGLASKAQVQRVVMGLLSINSLPRYADVTDALALAIAHSYIERPNR